MKQILLLFALVTFIASYQSNAQFSRYIVRFKNKTGTPYSVDNPTAFISQRAIERRARYNIAIDEMDLPITPRYIDSLRLAGNVSIINVSKWLNQVCILTNDVAALNKINSFDFVFNTAPIAAKVTAALQPVSKQFDPVQPAATAVPASVLNTTGFYDYGSTFDQVHLHNAEFLHNLGFRGQGMQLAVMDGGFYRYQTLPTFDSVRLNGQILDTWDFVTNNSSVNEDDSHGMKCLSTIAANIPGSFVGTAPAASFYLFRTEDVATEYPVEEQNWAAAAERADSSGADVFSVSLGYNTFDNSSFNYTYSDMTGNKTLIAKAANIAAKKGILVVAAAGNEGASSWRYVSTLGDADSALTIGAVNINKQVASFSSYGPNSDGQIKPDVAAVGSNAVVASSNTGLPVFGSGTSFACPIMAGISTCLWQAFPEVKNLDIIAGLRRASDRYNNPDDRTGYGIPDVKVAFVNFIKQLHTQTAVINNCNAVFNYDIKAASGMSVVLERLLPSDNNYVGILTKNFTGNFSKQLFTLTDSLSQFTSGVTIRYRIKMSIGTDTSFYVDSTALAYTTQCAEITDRLICPGNATYFSVNPVAGGSTYQWQQNAGTGFVPIPANNAFYSGGNTSTLLLNNIPQNFYGYQYRCAITNGSSTAFSPPITLKFSTTWTGAVSTAWEDSRNWSCGIVPTQYTDVVIKGAVSNYPVVSSAAVCHAISTLAGVSVLVKNGFSLEITGH